MLQRRSVVWRSLLFALLWWALTPVSTLAQADDARALIRNRAEQLHGTGELRVIETPIASRQVLPEFYRARGYAPAWSNPRALNGLVRAIQTSAIDQAVATGKTLTINLRMPVPVLLLYWTAAADPDGQVEFLPDIYGRDPGVLKALSGEFMYRKRPVLRTISR
jgi:murein L,D-transpeptidase YcbB/YkuD